MADPVNLLHRREEVIRLAGEAGIAADTFEEWEGYELGLYAVNFAVGSNFRAVQAAAHANARSDVWALDLGNRSLSITGQSAREFKAKLDAAGISYSPASVSDAFIDRLHSLADIVVLARSTQQPQLVVEVRREADLRSTVPALKWYMRQTRSPQGLLIVGQRALLLRDTYRSEAQPVEVVWDLPTAAVDALTPPPDTAAGAGFEFEARVQRWLESLSDAEAVQRIPEPLRSRVKEDLVPVVESGLVSATGPRTQYPRRF